MRVGHCLLAVGLALSGCGGDHAQHRRPEPNRGLPAQRKSRSQNTVSFRVLQEAATIINSGSPASLALFSIIDQRVSVAPDSSARIVHLQRGFAQFASRADRERWVRLGRPALPGLRPFRQETKINVGQFSFLPSPGPPLTLADVKLLGGSPNRVRRAIAAHVAAVTRQKPPSVLFRDYAFLLGLAPLRLNARRAVAVDIRKLPGAHSCGRARDLLGRSGLALCLSDGYEEVKVVFDGPADVVLGLSLKLERRLPAYANLRPGRVIEADTFAAH
jgi:hypothetical protein